MLSLRANCRFSGSSRCRSQPPCTRRVGSGKLYHASTCGCQIRRVVKRARGAWVREGEALTNWCCCSQRELRSSFDWSTSASSFSGLFRLRFGGCRCGRARVIGMTISSKPACIPNGAAVEQARKKGRDAGGSGLGPLSCTHPCLHTHRSFADPRRSCGPPRAPGCWLRS